MLTLYYQGRIRVMVDPHPFIGLEAVPDAVEYLMTGRNTGKIVIRIGDPTRFGFDANS
jgi:NADPH-dependent curcumin reductase CurA